MNPDFVLLADDDADDRMVISRALGQCGFPVEIRCVENGEELLAYLRDENGPIPDRRPRCILLDLNMPRMNGQDAAREIKADPQLCDIPLIMLTTSNAPMDVSRAREVGVDRFATKPSSFTEMVALLAELTGPWLRPDRPTK